jgi:hypothetical protein
VLSEHVLEIGQPPRGTARLLARDRDCKLGGVADALHPNAQSMKRIVVTCMGVLLRLAAQVAERCAHQVR